MALNPVVCGLDIVRRLEVTDPVSAALLLAMPGPIFAWTSANVQANPALGIPLIALGPKIVGTGGLIVPSDAPLTAALASALGMTDETSISKMGVVTKHYAEVLRSSGQIKTDLLIAYANPLPPQGPVAGIGGITVSKPFEFWKALELSDDDSIAKWTAFGEALKAHLELFAQIAPTMTNTFGGPVVGSGAIT